MDKYKVTIYSEQGTFNGVNVIPFHPIDISNEDYRLQREYFESIDRYIRNFYPSGSKVFIKFSLKYSQDIASGSKKETRKHRLLIYLKKILCL